MVQKSCDCQDYMYRSLFLKVLVFANVMNVGSIIAILLTESNHQFQICTILLNQCMRIYWQYLILKKTTCHYPCGVCLEWMSQQKCGCVHYNAFPEWMKESPKAFSFFLKSIKDLFPWLMFIRLDCQYMFGPSYFVRPLFQMNGTLFAMSYSGKAKTFGTNDRYV